MVTKNKKKTLNLYNHIGGREIQQGTQEKTSMKTLRYLENGVGSTGVKWKY